jgi:DNA-binding NarL/FixJ family response regulator
LMRGDWQSAAEYWCDIGCPYEHAEALMEGDVTAVKRALELFETLGATPAAAWASQRLRQLGAGRRPRGRRASTREHPGGLTARESEILAMLARNLGNPDIAARLFVSRKTIEHHVSAILGKLGVSSREDAVAVALAKGWISTTP